MAIRSPSITLSNGVEMPQMGLGTWVTTPAEMKAALKIAIETGYRLLDTASLYKNEGAIGETIQELIKSGAIKREDLFIITKRHKSGLASLSARKIPKSTALMLMTKKV
ncbi:hypothetical protein RB195_021814 [Necator americanus]|uniref:NADP-dependent oxidoreductase domain-containing protein n=1 Tax=Necator americanus TaxID=51031 RepID=A0ABR1EDE4_NECAM